MPTKQLAALALTLFIAVAPRANAAHAADANYSLPDTLPEEDGTLLPRVAIQMEDYAQARAAFRTRLLRRGPAPQASESLHVPAGVEVATFRSGDLALRAWVSGPTRRKGAKSPAVVFLHGGSSFGEEDWGMSQSFRDSGFVVMSPILRGENGQPGAFSLFYDEVDDVLAAARYLTSRSDVDSTRIYVSGHSMGGTLALLAAMASRQFRGATSLSGSPDQVIFCRYGMPAKQIPFDPADLRELVMRSPLAFATSFKCPVRMYYGSNERHFKLSIERTADLARARGSDVEARVVEGGHMTAIEPAVLQSITFFRRH